jgi:hypothetical protein
MKKIYFDIDNGSVVKVRDITSPDHYAVIDDTLKIKEIYSCFSSQKLEHLGYEWREKMIHKDCFEWVNYRWLMKSLKDYIELNVSIDDCEDENNQHYKYLRFWQSED